MRPVGKYVFLLLAIIPFQVQAQTYKDSLLRYRQEYKEEFITDARSPLKGTDTAFLRFYAPDRSYRITATFQQTRNAPVFMIPTHSGKTKPYREYGVINFRLQGKKYKLHAYQSADTAKKDLARYLFIPFTDLTNDRETFGGGRYIDIDTGDVKNNKLILDFNKCYNPYCAYAEGYSCPIPPDENRLPTAIKAGEKMFGKNNMTSPKKG
jgi:uncharacterized protein (DUF1684 family)